MPIYTLQGPDGKRYRIEGPEGATPEQLASVIQGQSATRTPAEPTRIDPTEGMSGGQKFLAGVGKAFVDTGRGAAQLFGLGDAQEIAEARKRDEALMNTGAGMAGNIVGNLAAYAPLAAVPGANTIAGGAALGALTGAVQPTVEGESRLANAVVGGIAGGAVPAAVRVGKTVKAAAIDPFTEAGRTRIAGGVLNRTAGDANAAAAKMAAAKGVTPGFNPTAGQVADDAGIATLERTVRQSTPGAFGEVEQSQRQALADAVRGIGGDDVARNAAVQSRDSAAEALYGQAFKSDAMRQDIANQALKVRANIATGGLGVGQARAAEQMGGDLATPGLRDLAQRPMFRQAIEQARTLAANKGVTINDPLQSLEGLHYIKLALDDMANPQAATAMGRNASAAVNSMRTSLTDELAKVSPLYGNARQTFSDMSRPINQMDIGRALAERLIPAGYRDMPSPLQINGQSYARALIDQGDDIARNVTGMKGARLESIMEPDQMQALRGVVSDLQAVKAGENLGRGPGSDTMQKIAMSHISAEAGIPNWMASVARVPGGWAKRAGDVLYGDSDRQVQAMMAELLKNPQQAAKAMQAAGVSPSMTAQLLERGAQGAALTSIPMALNP